MTYKNADELLVYSDETWQFFQTCIIKFKNKYSFW
jgi:hypothetical protein